MFTDSSPINFLFQVAPLPTNTQTIYGQGEASFHSYKSTLRRQIIGRTSLLDDVLTTLENCARIIQQDQAHVMAGGEETQWVIILFCFADVEFG
jgi:conserved oligomeric Golgi complex subunit 1